MSAQGCTLTRQAYSMIKKIWFFFFYISLSLEDNLPWCKKIPFWWNKGPESKHGLHISGSHPLEFPSSYGLGTTSMGGLPRKLRTHRKWEMSQQEGSFLWVSLNVTLEWAPDSRSQNRIKIWNQEFAHKGAFTGSWLGTPAEVQPQAWTQCSPLTQLVIPTSWELCTTNSFYVPLRERATTMQFGVSWDRRVSAMKIRNH